MRTQDIVNVLTEMNIPYQIDHGNPDYVVLLKSGGQIDTNDPTGAMSWTIVSLDRNFWREAFTTDDVRNMVAEMYRLGYS
jgi:hypothetical protein